jgi:hypothetical protein
MDFILDSNIYINDYRMRGPQFGEFFAHLKRTKSRLVTPAIVIDEVIERYRKDISEAFNTAKRSWKELQNKCLSDAVNLPDVDVHKEVEYMKQRLERPISGVEVSVVSDLSRVDIAEVVRRGIKRIRPANGKGEELRDVVIWLFVLGYAKESKSEVAFISGDRTFRCEEVESLHPDLQKDISDADVDVTFHPSLAQCIAEHSLSIQTIREAWLEKYITREKIKEELTRLVGRLEINGGAVEDIAIESLDFLGGKRYKVAGRSFYAEAEYRGKAAFSVNAFKNIFKNMLRGTQTVNVSSTISPSGALIEPGTAFTIPLGEIGNVQNAIQTPRPEALMYTSSAVANLGLGSFREPSIRRYRCSLRMFLSARVEEEKLGEWQIEDWRVEELNSRHSET